MRKINAIITVIMMVLFLLHAITGALQISNINPALYMVTTISAFMLLAVMAVHIVIGIILTVKSLKACKKAGVSYFKENLMFWAGRISGLAIIIFMGIHVSIFIGDFSDGTYKLNYFGIVELITQICLVLSIALHVFTQVRSSMIALGTKSYKKYMADILIVLSVLLIFFGIAFFIYYLRWLG